MRVLARYRKELVSSRYSPAYNAIELVDLYMISFAAKCHRHSLHRPGAKK
jgi:hypothetical protein